MATGLTIRYEELDVLFEHRVRTRDFKDYVVNPYSETEALTKEE